MAQNKMRYYLEKAREFARNDNWNNVYDYMEKSLKEAYATGTSETTFREALAEILSGAILIDEAIQELEWDKDKYGWFYKEFDK